MPQNTTRARGGQAGWKLLLVAIACVWGFSFVVMKDVLDALPTFYLLACRFGPAALIIGALFFRRVRAGLDRHTVCCGLLMGVFMWGGYALQTLGLTGTTPGKNAFLTGTYCVLVPFIGHLMGDTRLSRWNLGAAALCLTGIGLVALDNLSVSAGDLLTLGCAVMFSIQLAQAAKFGKTTDAMATTFWMFVVVAVLSLACHLLFEAPVPASSWTPEVGGWMAFLAVVCTALNLLGMNAGLARVPGDSGSLLLSMESPSGVLFSVLLGGEQLTARLLCGFAVIFLAVVMSETRFRFLKPLLKQA